jgi:hypothetical protein
MIVINSYSKSNLKKIISLLLCACFSFFNAGYFILFWSMQTLTKQEMKEVISTCNYNKAELTLIKIHKDDYKNLTWTEPNEFSLYGNMYDVIHKQVKNDSIYILCIFDKIETLLVTHLNDYVNNLLNTDSAIKNVLKTLTLNLHFSPINTFFTITAYSFAHFQHSRNYISPTLDKVTPPPKLEL